jgi:hypothetical protein
MRSMRSTSAQEIPAREPWLKICNSTCGAIPAAIFATNVNQLMAQQYPTVDLPFNPHNPYDNEAA